MKNLSIEKIDKIKEMCKDKGIHLFYTKLPRKINCLYVQYEEGMKTITINEDIKNTDLEIREIALGLGYDKAVKKLNIKKSERNERNTSIINQMANFYKNRLLEELLISCPTEMSDSRGGTSIGI